MRDNTVSTKWSTRIPLWLSEEAERQNPDESRSEINRRALLLLVTTKDDDD
jgi:hypothetical protein